MIQPYCLPRLRETVPKSGALTLVVLLGTLCGGRGADCSPAPSRLVAWWPADTGGADIAGTNNGVLMGGAAVVGGGRVGNAFSFNGTTAYVQVPDSPLLKPTNLTVEAWVRFNTLDTPGNASPGQQYIIFKQNSRVGNFEGYDLGKDRVGSQDFLVFRVTSAAGQVVNAFATSQVATGVWYHVAGVRGSNYLQFYLNGALQSQTNVSFPQNYGTQPLFFGSSGQTYWDRKFSGLLDEVSLYDRALSSNEIAAIYAAGAEGKCKEVRIALGPTNQTVIAGGSAVFNVLATGFGNLSYQWRFNASPISGATGSSLLLTNIQTSQAGAYDVVITNSVSSATSAVATLTVWVPPVITAPPQSRTNLAGIEAVFVVAASGVPSPSYQWRKDGLNLAGATAGVLTLSNVSTNDAGAYEVVVSNPAGSVTSSPPAMLTVWVPPVITAPPQSRTNIAGTEAVFTVTAFGLPSPSYQWRRNGAPLPGEISSVLLLPKVTVGDAGVYDVIVSNPAGSVTSLPPATLTVWVPPLITVQPQSRTNLAGTTAAFSVVADGTAPLAYQWRFQGAVIAGATGSSYSRANVQAGDEGSFDVVISNIAGVTNSQPATLTVWIPPFIVSQPQDLDLNPGQVALFSVAAAGTPPLNYQWQFNGSNILNATASTYARSNVQPADAGHYSVVVTNMAGGVTSRLARLSVGLPPVVTAQPQSRTNLAGTDASFSVSVTGTTPLSYRWQFNGSDLPGATGSTLIRTNVSALDAGPYRVIVTNVAGAVTSQVAVLTVWFPPVITAQPRSATVLQNQTTNFTVQAVGTLPLSYQWRFNGNNLPGATSSMLVLFSVQPANEGSYSVVVENVAGAVVSEAASLVVIPSDLAFIPDPNLSNALRCAVGKQSGMLAISDLRPLTCFSACSREITNLYGLHWATNLASLQLNNNRVQDLGPLRELTVLRQLEVEGNAIEDISPIQGLVNLTCLSPARNPITNHAALAGLTNLTKLSLWRTRATTNGFLGGMTRLRHLNLRENGIREIGSLSRLAQLEVLDLRWNLLTNVGGLFSGPTNLESLYLGGNYLTNLPSFTPLRRLALLNLDENWVRDISPLAGLTNLTYLSLNRNPITNFAPLTTLTGLANLELAGNSISNINFLTAMPQLRFVDLSFNRVSNLDPLLALSNLTSVVLAGNPGADFVKFADLASLQSLWLHNNSISDAGFVHKMHQLQYLDLGQNLVDDIHPLVQLTNLTGLGLDRNPVTNLSLVGGFSNLVSLRLDGQCRTEAELGFLTGLPKLEFLSLNQNQMADAAILTNCGSLRSLYLHRNRISEMQPLLSLGELVDVDVSGNALLLGQGSSALEALRQLQCRKAGVPLCGCAPENLPEGVEPCEGVRVRHEPQNTPPVIQGLTRWYLPCQGSRQAVLSLWDDSFAEEASPCQPLQVWAASANPNAVAVSEVNFNPTNRLVTLTITNSQCGAVGGSVAIQLTAVDAAGFAGVHEIEVIVVTNLPVVSLCPAVDTNLLNAIAGRYRAPAASLTPAELLMLTNLSAANVNAADPCVWDWLTNLAALHLSGGVVPDLGFLAALPGLRNLSLTEGAVSSLDTLGISPLLESLDLTRSPLLNYSLLPSRASNLSYLGLAGHDLRSIDFLAGLTGLRTLVLDDNRVVDIIAIAGLTNLESLRISENFVTNIAATVQLPRLRFLDLRTNLVDLRVGSPGRNDLFALTNQGRVVVEFVTQRDPRFDVRTNWVVESGGLATTTFRLLDLKPAHAVIWATAAPAGVIPQVELLPGITNELTLRVTVAPGLNGAAGWITLWATNDVPLAFGTNILLTVIPFQPVTNGVLGSPSDFSWTTAGHLPWFGQTLITHDGASAAQSGAIDDFGVSRLQTTVAGPGRLGFWWKISSEPDYDWLSLYVNSVLQERISGEVDWQQRFVTLPMGTHTIRWEYSKDKDTSVGLDAAWVDEVVLEPFLWLETVGQPTNGHMLLILHLAPGRPYELQASSNYFEWMTLTGGVATTNRMFYLDTNATPTLRFYRLRQPSGVPDAALRIEGGPRNDEVRLLLRGNPGDQYRLEASGDLEDWFTLDLIQFATNRVYYVDASATSAVRFYRVLRQ